MITILDNGLLVSDMLKSMGINDADQLAKRSSTYKSRQKLARQIVDWIAAADLARIKGIGKSYISLLYACEVKSVRELSYRTPENLFNEMKAINAQRNIVRSLPSGGWVATWIERARSAAHTAAE